jgi:hypothetical protein
MALFRRNKSPFAHEIDRFHAVPAPKVRWDDRKTRGTSPAAKEGTRSSDLVIAALGIALGLTCAFFPWYIFFNQEKFGVRPMKFEGGGTGTSGPVSVGPQPQKIGAPMTAEDIPIMQLDLFSTGALPADDDAANQGARAPGLDQQPFPGDTAQFQLIHVANGRAMIQDDAGLWVVQTGSILPDSSRVSSIEKRKGKWVLVTSMDRVVELTP